MLATQAPYAQYFDKDGSPLDSGYVYFGTVQLNPETNPITVYWDAAGTQPALQPIRTLNGYPVRNGTPGTVYADGNYSTSVKDKRGSLIVYAPDSATLSNSASVLAQLVAFMVSLASSIGASLVGFIQAGVGAVMRTVQDKLRDEVSVFDFMSAAQKADVIAGTLAIDVSGPFQAAIDACCPIIGGTLVVKSLHVPSGRYLIGTTLNLTNTRAAGTRSRDGFLMYGDGMVATQLVGATGDGWAVIETTGSQWLTLRDFFIDGSFAPSNKSTVGIFQGVSTALNQTQNQKFERIYINLHSSAVANGGAGTIALWNFGAEENTYDTVFFVGNRALFLTGYNNGTGGIAPYTHSYQTLQTTHSIGVTTFMGECFLNTVDGLFPAILTVDANSVSFQALYSANLGLAGTNDVMWEVRGQLAGVSLAGTIESMATLFKVYGIVTGANVRVTFGTVTSGTAAYIQLDRGGQGQIVDSDFKITPTSTNRKLITCNPSVPSEAVSCFVSNSTFNTGLPEGFCQMQENVLWNPNTSDVTISGASGYRLTIGKGWQEFDIPELTVVTGGTRLCQVTLPTLNTGIAAGAVSVEVIGNVRISSAGSAAMSSRWTRNTASFATSNTQVPTVAAATAETAITANITPASNNITGFGLTLIPTGTTRVDLIGSPTYTGAAAEAMSGKFTVRMYWGGWVGVAPSLLH